MKDEGGCELYEVMGPVATPSMVVDKEKWVKKNKQGGRT